MAVNDRRPSLDLYPIALGALGLLALVFLSARNGAALIMCGLIFAGLVAGRLAGFSDRILVAVALGLVVILWMVWIDPPASSRRTSALAHGAGGALVGWALCEYLRPRMRWPLWAIGALVLVVAMTLVWELGELVADRAFETALDPNPRDSAEDVFFGSLGGTAAIVVASLLAPVRRR